MNTIIKIVKNSSHELGANIVRIFSGRNLLWHFLAFILTYVSVVSGFDWFYFRTFSHGWVLYYLFPAAIIGFLFPIFFPLVLLIAARNKPRTMHTAYAIIQSAFLGWTVSSFYKIFTGRAHPVLSSLADVSHIFKFGFFRGGIFWGWPSSHTTVAFAVGIALYQLYPESRLVRSLALLFAIYVGLGVSVSIHWFSDFIAGAIIGSVIGLVVSQSFKKINYA